MPGYCQVETAARIGMLAGERDSATACAEALRLLGELLPNDTAALVALNPFTGAHYKLAGIGCTEQAARLLAVEFVNSPWFTDVLTEPLPPAASAESGRSYRHGWFYQEYVRPAGIRDAMSGALRSQGRYVGMIHLSAERADTFTIEARQLLASVLPALAVLADTTGRVAADLPCDALAALITRDHVVDVPGRARPPVLDDHDFGRLLREFSESGGQRLRLLWPAGRNWYRVVLIRHEPTGGRMARAILVWARPASLPFGLSRRELDILTRTAMGQTNQAIADELFLSPRTVHSHVEHVLRKTGTASRAEAAALAMRDGVLRPAPGSLRHFTHSELR
jgi:DNA-binding CsgD family transcriptional regulator